MCTSEIKSQVSVQRRKFDACRDSFSPKNFSPSSKFCCAEVIGGFLVAFQINISELKFPTRCQFIMAFQNYLRDDMPAGDSFDGSEAEVNSEDSLLHNCLICMYELTPFNFHSLFCCGRSYCLDCLRLHVGFKVAEDMPHIACPSDRCDGEMEDCEVRVFITPENAERYERLLAIRNENGSVRLCPACSEISHAPPKRHSVKGSHVACEKCNFEWCFECGSPWHESVGCHDSCKLEKDFKRWRETRVSDTPNAQRCPKCEIILQRSLSCNTVTCPLCRTTFCYLCGGKHHKLPIFGSHTSTFGVLGCKYNLMPGKTVRRRAIRGSILVARVAICAPVGVLVAAGILAVSPVYGTYKIAKKLSPLAVFLRGVGVP